MQITAKFAGTCPDCGGGYAEGSRIEWERDKKARHVSCPERSSGLRLIGGGAPPSTGMNKPSPIFPVAVPSTRSAEENVKAIEAHAHVVEVKEPYALIHASPSGVAKIAELGLEVFQSKRGGEYYAVRIAKGANLGLVPAARQAAPVAPPAPVQVQARAPQAQPVEPGLVRMVLKGNDYLARETRVKRTNMDVRRFEVRKDGECVEAPYVVSFQSEDGHSAQCSCPDWIYRRRMCKHIVGCQVTFARARQTEMAIAN